MTETIKELETAGEFAKCIILFADDQGTYRAVDTVYDQGTGLVSLLVSRGHGKLTKTWEYTAEQTNTAILTPPSGKKLDIVGALILTDGTTGDAYLTFETSGKIVMPLYATAFKRSINDDMHIEGCIDEPLTLNTTTGTSKVFVLVNYRIVDPYEGEGHCLTPALFRVNPATGTMTYPPGINNDNLEDGAYGDAIGEYCEIDLGGTFKFTEYRQFTSGDLVGDGRFKIQYYDGVWHDWLTDQAIGTVVAAWGDWVEGEEVTGSKIRFVLTTLDTGLYPGEFLEMEVRYRG